MCSYSHTTIARGTTVRPRQNHKKRRSIFSGCKNSCSLSLFLDQEFSSRKEYCIALCSKKPRDRRKDFIHWICSVYSQNLCIQSVAKRCPGGMLRRGWPLSSSVGVSLIQIVIWLQVLTVIVTHSNGTGLEIALSNKEGFERATSCRHGVARIVITNKVRSRWKHYLKTSRPEFHVRNCSNMSQHLTGWSWLRDSIHSAWTRNYCASGRVFVHPSQYRCRARTATAILRGWCRREDVKTITWTSSCNAAPTLAALSTTLGIGCRCHTIALECVATCWSRGVVSSLFLEKQPTSSLFH